MAQSKTLTFNTFIPAVLPFVGKADKTTVIHVVHPDDYAAWLKHQDKIAQHWLSHQCPEPTAGQYAQIPATDGCLRFGVGSLQ